MAKAIEDDPEGLQRLSDLFENQHPVVADALVRMFEIDESVVGQIQDSVYYLSNTLNRELEAAGFNNFGVGVGFKFLEDSKDALDELLLHINMIGNYGSRKMQEAMDFSDALTVALQQAADKAASDIDPEAIGETFAQIIYDATKYMAIDIDTADNFGTAITQALQEAHEMAVGRVDAKEVGELIAGVLQKASEVATQSWDATDIGAAITDAMLSALDSIESEPIDEIITRATRSSNANTAAAIARVAAQSAEVLIEKFENAAKAVVDTMEGATKALVSKVEDTTKTIVSATGYAAEAIVSKVKDTAETIVNIMEHTTRRIYDMLTTSGFEIGAAFFNKLGQGMITKHAALLQQALATANAIRAAFGSPGMNTIPASRSPTPLAIGLNRVPYDNFPALLHRNEMVLTAQQAKEYREGKSADRLADDGRVVVHQHFYGVKEEKTAFELYRAAKRAYGEALV